MAKPPKKQRPKSLTNNLKKKKNKYKNQISA